MLPSQRDVGADCLYAAEETSSRPRHYRTEVVHGVSALPWWLVRQRLPATSSCTRSPCRRGRPTMLSLLRHRSGAMCMLRQGSTDVNGYTHILSNTMLSALVAQQLHPTFTAQTRCASLCCEHNTTGTALMLLQSTTSCQNKSCVPTATVAQATVKQPATRRQQKCMRAPRRAEPPPKRAAKFEPHVPAKLTRPLS